MTAITKLGRQFSTERPVTQVILGSRTMLNSFVGVKLINYVIDLQTKYYLCNTSIISRLRSFTSLPRPISRTKKFQSFLNFARINYQPPLSISPTFLFVIIVLLSLFSLSLFALVPYSVLVICYSAIRLLSCKCEIKLSAMIKIKLAVAFAKLYWHCATGFEKFCAKTPC